MGKNNVKPAGKLKVDKELNAYAGKNLSPRKTTHINSIANNIRIALSKYKQQLPAQ